MHWMDGWHMGWMGAWWILAVVAIMTALWFIASASRGSKGNGGSPRQILKRRYARGEIDRETYQNMLRDL